MARTTNWMYRKLRDGRTVARIIIEAINKKLQKNEGRNGFESTMMKWWTNDAAEVLLPQTWEVLINEFK